MKKLLLVICLGTFGITNAQLSTGVIGYFPFNNDVNDASSSGIIGTSTGSTFGADRNGVANMAASFNGSSYVTFNDNSIKEPLPITISAWVYVNSFPSSGGIATPIIYSDGEHSNYSGYMMGMVSPGQVYVQFGTDTGGSNSSNRRTYVTNNAISTGAWHHIVGVINSFNDMEIYVDCQLAAGTYNGSGSAMAYTNSNSRIGSGVGNGTTPGGFFLDGRVDELIIWNRQLTTNEINTVCDQNSNLLAVEEQGLTKQKELVKIVDFLGRETNFTPNTPLIYIYSDGTTERIMKIEK